MDKSIILDCAPIIKRPHKLHDLIVENTHLEAFWQPDNTELAAEVNGRVFTWDYGFIPNEVWANSLPTINSRIEALRCAGAIR